MSNKRFVEQEPSLVSFQSMIFVFMCELVNVLLKCIMKNGKQNLNILSTNKAPYELTKWTQNELK